MSLDSGTLRIGHVVGDKYRLVAKIGDGGMGSVYKAEHTFMSRIVALKVLHGHLAQNQKALKRFQQEAKTASKIVHRNAVTLYDFGIDRKLPYLAMEYVEGPTLRKALAKTGPMELHQIYGVMKQVCEGLEAAHKLNIVHRDLKPDNIMIAKDEDGVQIVKVLDFGIAKVFAESGEAQTALTQAGTVLGTPQYMSPEQSLVDKLDARSDIYSLGIILYEMLTGDVPFNAPSMMQILMKHVNDQVPLPSKVKPELEIPESVERVVMKALAKKKDDRYQSCTELLEDFENAVRNSDSRGIKLPFEIKEVIDTSRFKQVALSGPVKPVHLQAAAVVGMLIVVVVLVMHRFGGGQRAVTSAQNAQVERVAKEPRRARPSDEMKSAAVTKKAQQDEPTKLARVTEKTNSKPKSSAQTKQPVKTVPTASAKSASASFPGLSAKQLSEIFPELGDIKPGSVAKPEMLDSYRQAAKLGDSTAMLKLGMLYDQGRGVSQDYDQALKWYGRARRLGDVEALYILGTMYQTGRGTRKDEVVAINLFKEAGEQGHAESSFRAAQMFQKGRGVMWPDEKASIAWFRRAVAAGHPPAMAALAELYDKGRGIPADVNKAFELYRDAATAGDVPAMVRLGQFYERGRGVERDYAEAAKWYKQAAEAGERSAMKNLAWMYRDGRGVEKSAELADKWLQRANNAQQTTS